MTVPQCLINCNFVVCFQIRNCDECLQALPTSGILYLFQSIWSSLLVLVFFFSENVIIPHFQLLILSFAIYPSINPIYLVEPYNLISGNPIISSGLFFKSIFIVSVPCIYIQFFKNFCIYLEILIAEYLESIFICI